MKRGDPPSHAQPVEADRKYNPFFNRRCELVRGLWERNAMLYAQANVRGWIGRVPLHEAKHYLKPRRLGKSSKHKSRPENRKRQPNEPTKIRPSR